MLYILVGFLLVLTRIELTIFIKLTIFTCAMLYAFLVAAYNIISDWIRNLKWKRRCAGRRRK